MTPAAARKLATKTAKEQVRKAGLKGAKARAVVRSVVRETMGRVTL